jgi:hypothetical protein
MTTHPETRPAASQAATREAAAFTDLAHWATRRAYLLTEGHATPNQGAEALARVCATTIEEDDDLGLERGSDWTDDLLDMMRLLARKDEQR